MSANVKRWLLTVGILSIGGGLLAYYMATWKPILGKWTQVTGQVPPMLQQLQNADETGERGMIFYRGSQFATFGYKMDGRVVDSYGIYDWLASNRVRMQVIGFRTVVGGTNMDVKLPGKFPNELNPPKYLTYDPERRELSEEDPWGSRATFRREYQSTSKPNETK